MYAPLLILTRVFNF